MNDHHRFAELLAHLIVAMVSLGVVAYVAIRQRTIRRTMRQPQLAYWLALLVSLFCAGVNVMYLVCWFALDQGIHPVVWMDLLTEYPSVVAQSIAIMALVSLRVSRHS